MAQSAHHYPFWAPRFWHGMRMHDWLALLTRNRWRLHPTRYGLAATVSLCTVFNTKMSIVQEALFGHQVRRTRIDPDPIFILGHWRSGTTFLHELMAHDRRFATPTTYQCFAPSHFLVTDPAMPRMLRYLMPSRRPMDNVEVGWNAPQEDEFALCSMGIPSPYLRMAFPNQTPPYLEYLDMAGVTPQQQLRWQRAFKGFLQAVTLRTGRRLVLKSPTHTGRIGLLARMFPGARFIHLVRDPLVLYPSTIKLWTTLDPIQALQVPKQAALEQYVFAAFERMYGGFWQGAAGLEEHRLCTVHYEKLVADPLQELQRIYGHLELGDFEAVRGEVSQFVRRKKDYRTNRYQISPECRQQVLSRWERYFEQYSYSNGR